jgi:hypothetical protein
VRECSKIQPNSTKSAEDFLYIKRPKITLSEGEVGFMLFVFRFISGDLLNAHKIRS